MRGQISAEFVISISLMSLLFIFGIAIYRDQGSSHMYIENMYNQRALAWKIARGIDAVHVAGNGSSTLVFVRNINYSIDIGNGTVYVAWGNQVVSAPLVTKNTTMGTVTTGGYLNISNTGGVVNVANHA